MVNIRWLSISFQFQQANLRPWKIHSFAEHLPQGPIICLHSTAFQYGWQIKWQKCVHVTNFRVTDVSQGKRYNEKLNSFFLSFFPLHLLLLVFSFFRFIVSFLPLYTYIYIYIYICTWIWNSFSHSTFKLSLSFSPLPASDIFLFIPCYFYFYYFTFFKNKCSIMIIKRTNSICTTQHLYWRMRHTNSYRIWTYKRIT